MRDTVPLGLQCCQEHEQWSGDDDTHLSIMNKPRADHHCKAKRTLAMAQLLVLLHNCLAMLTDWSQA
jgi:hypothetical protein